MTYQEVLENARKKLQPRCHVCPVCDCRACAGVVPGPGGKGSGSTAKRNWRYLHDHVKLHMNVLGKGGPADTGFSCFGQLFSAPVFAAPIGMVANNLSDVLDEDTYAEAILAGTKAVGAGAFTGGGPMNKCFYAPLDAIKANGWGIPTLKPWRMSVVEERLPLVIGSGAPAFAMDIDSAGLPHARLSTEPMEMKNADDLARLVSLTKLPFVVKGIMTAESARQAAEAGVYAIVVSNHGGRVLEDGLSTAEVLPEIRAAVGDSVKLFVDGGIRSGADVFKVLALGADAALVGRPCSAAAYGGGAEGVQLYFEKLITELKSTMAMTGCQRLKDIKRELIRIV